MAAGGQEATSGESSPGRPLFLSRDRIKKEGKEKQAVFHFCTLHLVIIIHAGASLNTKRGKYYSCSDFTR